MNPLKIRYASKQMVEKQFRVFPTVRNGWPWIKSDLDKPHQAATARIRELGKQTLFILRYSSLRPSTVSNIICELPAETLSDYRKLCVTS